MLEVKTVSINRILNPTSIDLGDYVINPYLGCEYSCLYCYVRSNKAVIKRKQPWGTYVDVRTNAPDLLEAEIALKKPRMVLLGSTTECFQPIDRKTQLTAQILEILNKHEIFCVILTRSPHIINYIPLLRQGYCKQIYFTINSYQHNVKQILEPKSPSFASRIDAIRTLLETGISVIPYYSPVIPWITDTSDLFSPFKKAKRIEFEYINFQLKNIGEIVAKISAGDTVLREKFNLMQSDNAYYQQTLQDMDNEITLQAKKAKKDFKIYRHSFGGFFSNTYAFGEPGMSSG